MQLLSCKKNLPQKAPLSSPARGEDHSWASRQPTPLLDIGAHPPQNWHAMRRLPGHKVGNLLRRQRLTRDITTPVWHLEVCATSDDGSPQRLVADQRQEGGIHDCPSLLATAPVGPVAAGTSYGIHLPASLRISRRRGAMGDGLGRIVGRQREVFDQRWLAPARQHVADQGVDCASVSAPPALAANAGMAVSGTP